MGLEEEEEKGFRDGDGQKKGDEEEESGWHAFGHHTEIHQIAESVALSSSSSHFSSSSSEQSEARQQLAASPPLLGMGANGTWE